MRRAEGREGWILLERLPGRERIKAAGMDSGILMQKAQPRPQAEMKEGQLNSMQPVESVGAEQRSFGTKNPPKRKRDRIGEAEGGELAPKGGRR